MNLEQFAQKCDLVSKPEIEKVALLAFFFRQTENKFDFGRDDIRDWFDRLHFTQPNMSRLAQRLTKSAIFTKGKSKDSNCLHSKKLAQFKSTFSWLSDNSEEIVFSGEILPETVFAGTRGYIELLAKQINASYEKNIYDGCAVLMRRLIEVLLIHAYQLIGEEAQIKATNDQYKDLSTIIKNATSNPTLNLSKGTKDCLDVFRVLGNFSAHRIEYNCTRGDIKKIALDYRAAVEELLYKSGVRK